MQRLIGLFLSQKTVCSAGGSDMLLLVQNRKSTPD